MQKGHYIDSNMWIIYFLLIKIDSLNISIYRDKYISILYELSFNKRNFLSNTSHNNIASINHLYLDVSEYNHIEIKIIINEK